ncbi:MAG: uL15m family ribosomal protein [Nanoarchaeota archaeon]
MVVKKQRKVIRKRGSRRHGYGRAHRGSGNKGGYGNASGGKKSDTKKRSFPAGYFGKEGFISHQKVVHTILNCRDLDSRIEHWTVQKLAKKEGDTYHIDLGTLGYDKLVGSGQITHKIKVTVAFAAKSVADKLKNAGGELVVQQ